MKNFYIYNIILLLNLKKILNLKYFPDSLYYNLQINHQFISSISYKYDCITTFNEFIKLQIKNVKNEFFEKVDLKEGTNIHVFMDINNYEKPLQICDKLDYVVVSKSCFFYYPETI